MEALMCGLALVTVCSQPQGGAAVSEATPRQAATSRPADNPPGESALGAILAVLQDFCGEIATPSARMIQSKAVVGWSMVSPYAHTLRVNVTVAWLHVQAQWYSRNGDLESVVSSLSQIITLAPTSKLARSKRGLAYLVLERYRDAILDFDRALQLGSDHDTLGARAYAYAALGDTSRAIEDYSAAIKLEPSHYFYRLGRANMYSQTQDYEKAIADYTEAIRSDPDGYAAYFNRGMAYAKAGKLKEALGDYTQQIRLRPKEPIGYLVRSRIYRRLGDEAKARADEEVLRKLPPIPGISITPERDAPPPPSSSQQPK